MSSRTRLSSAPSSQEWLGRRYSSKKRGRSNSVDANSAVVMDLRRTERWILSIGLHLACSMISIADHPLTRLPSWSSRITGEAGDDETTASPICWACGRPLSTKWRALVPSVDAGSDRRWTGGQPSGR